MLHDVLVRRNGIDDRGRETPCLAHALAAEYYLVAEFFCQVLAFVEHCLGDELRIFGIRFGSFAYLTDKLVFKAFQKLVGNFVRHRDLVDVYADLPGVAKLEKSDLPRGVF